MFYFLDILCFHIHHKKNNDTFVALFAISIPYIYVQKTATLQYTCQLVVYIDVPIYQVNQTNVTILRGSSSYSRISST